MIKKKYYLETTEILMVFLMLEAVNHSGLKAGMGEVT